MSCKPITAQPNLQPDHTRNTWADMISLHLPHLLYTKAAFFAGPNLTIYEMDTWAGVLPLHQQAPGKPVDDPQLKAGIRVPRYVSKYNRAPGSDLHKLDSKS